MTEMRAHAKSDIVVDLARVLGGGLRKVFATTTGWGQSSKVEPLGGDEVRDWGPPDPRATMRPCFVGINHNKRSIEQAPPPGRAHRTDEDAQGRRRPDQEFQTRHARQIGGIGSEGFRAQNFKTRSLPHLSGLRRALRVAAIQLSDPDFRR